MNLTSGQSIDEDIKHMMAWIASRVTIDNAQGLTDINIKLESFITKLLDPIWDCNLVNLNTYFDPNHPGIDIGDKDKRLWCQVTSTDSRDKVNNTIEKFEAEHTDLNFDELYVFMFKDRRPNFRKPFTTNGKYKFSPKKNIISISEYCFLVRDLPDEKKLEIHSYLARCLEGKLTVEFKITVEDFLIHKFIRALIEMAEEDGDDEVSYDAIDSADIDIKRERFEKYWSFIEARYREVVGTSEEKVFKKAFDRLDQSERLQLQSFLQRQSEKALLETSSPVKAIDILTKDIINRAQIGFLSEMQVENYLYYQLYMCKLLPNPVELEV